MPRFNRPQMIAYRRVTRSGPIVSYFADEAAARQAAEGDAIPCTDRTIQHEDGRVIDELPEIPRQEARKGTASAKQAAKAPSAPPKPEAPPKGD